MGTTYFKALEFDSLCQSLCECKSTLIIYPESNDVDAISSAFALRELLRLMRIPAYCASSRELPERLSFIADGVQGSVLVEEGLPIDCERVISVGASSPSQLGELFLRLHKNIDIMIDGNQQVTPFADHYIEPDALATGDVIYAVAQRLVEMGEVEELSERFLSCIYTALCWATNMFSSDSTASDTLRMAADIMDKGVNIPEINRMVLNII